MDWQELSVSGALSLSWVLCLCCELVVLKVCGRFDPVAWFYWLMCGPMFTYLFWCTIYECSLAGRVGVCYSCMCLLFCCLVMGPLNFVDDFYHIGVCGYWWGQVPIPLMLLAPGSLVAPWFSPAWSCVCASWGWSHESSCWGFLRVWCIVDMATSTFACKGCGRCGISISYHNPLFLRLLCLVGQVLVVFVGCSLGVFSVFMLVGLDRKSVV